MLNKLAGASAPGLDRTARAGDLGFRTERPAAPPLAFLVSAHPVGSWLLAPVRRVYARLFDLTQATPAFAWLVRQHFVFFLTAVAGMVLLTPRFLALGEFAIERYALRLAVERPDLSGWPYVPAVFLPLAALSLVTFFASTTWRVGVLIAASGGLGLATSYLDLVSLVPFGLFLVIVYSVITRPVSPALAAWSVVGVSLASLLLADRWIPGAAFTTVFLAFQTALIPMLWYAAYEARTPRRGMDLKGLSLYLYSRFFGSPVFTPADLLGPARDLVQTRFAGVKALYVALLASTVAAGADWAWQTFPPASLSGWRLLVASYVGYLGLYCEIVVRFNLVIGLLRLFGIPVRDNFNYWILARTPNEHWQRWNLLFREWVMTFVFFPVMRARRWMFGAIMASLGVSGVLHSIPELVHGDATAYDHTVGMSYWLINGLAIYAVIRVPQRFPGLMARLRVGEHWAWSAIGIVLTSAFYGVLHSLKYACHSWSDLAGYLARLASLA